MPLTTDRRADALEAAVPQAGSYWLAIFLDEFNPDVVPVSELADANYARLPVTLLLSGDGTSKSNDALLVFNNFTAVVTFFTFALMDAANGGDVVAWYPVQNELGATVVATVEPVDQVSIEASSLVVEVV